MRQFVVTFIRTNEVGEGDCSSESDILRMNWDIQAALDKAVLDTDPGMEWEGFKVIQIREAV